MSLKHPAAIEHRLDYSRFFVHLTRDDRKTDENGGSAEENFKRILDERQILNVRAHCLHGKGVPAEHYEAFKVACFTETPLTEIKNLVGVRRRQVNLEPYGFVFKREFLMRKGAQPAVYVNNYFGYKWVRESYDKVFNLAVKNDFNGRDWRMLPFVNVMNDVYDFAWEREWRLAKTLTFKCKDLVCVVLPEYEDDLRQKALVLGVNIIDANWTPERVVAEFAKQSKEMVALAKAAKPKLVLKKKRVQ